jgi:hypothetical protein
MFMQDLFKPSIRLKEDTSTLAPGASPIKAGRSPYQAPRQGKMAQRHQWEIVPGPRPGILRPTQDKQRS